jgi:hypothetical protein
MISNFSKFYLFSFGLDKCAARVFDKFRNKAIHFSENYKKIYNMIFQQDAKARHFIPHRIYDKIHKTLNESEERLKYYFH